MGVVVEHSQLSLHYNAPINFGDVTYKDSVDMAFNRIGLILTLIASIAMVVTGLYDVWW